YSVPVLHGVARDCVIACAAVRGLRLLSAGEAFEDLVFVGLPRLPGLGEEVRTNNFSSSIGGGAIITAVAAARLGVPVSVASGLSDHAAKRLRTEGVRVTKDRKSTRLNS